MNNNCADLKKIYDQITDGRREIAAALKLSKKECLKKGVPLMKNLQELLVEIEKKLGLYIAPEIMSVFKEIFRGERLNRIRVPDPYQLNLAYLNRMYPRRQRRDDKERGLVSFQPGNWTEKRGRDDELWGDAYSRAILKQGRNLARKMFLTESIQKPDTIDGREYYGTKEGFDSTKDPLQPLIRQIFGENATRFALSYSDIDSKLLPALQSLIIGRFVANKLPITIFSIHITPALVSNISMTYLHPENSQTNSSEWTGTELIDRDGWTLDENLIVGSTSTGGAAHVGSAKKTRRFSNRGFRISILINND